MTQPEKPPIDPGNTLLDICQATQETALVDTPQGQRLAYTIRTPSTTLTVFLAKTDADQWLAAFKTAVNVMSGAGLVVATSGRLARPANGRPAA